MGLDLEIYGSIALRPIIEEYHPRISEWPLFPKAVVQDAGKSVKLRSAYGQ
jgi:hypothetical protein